MSSSNVAVDNDRKGDLLLVNKQLALSLLYVRNKTSVPVVYRVNKTWVRV